MRKIPLDSIDLEITDVQGSINIQWDATIGFGELTIVAEDDGAVVYTEHMDKDDDKEFTKLVLSKLVEHLKVVG
jgi:hypothetical protein